MTTMFILNLSIIFISLVTVVINQQQDIMSSIAIQDNLQSLSINYQSISLNVQDLSLQIKPVYYNTYINKSISISSNQQFVYQSQILCPIYILDKQHCHSHQGTIKIQTLQHLSTHTSYKIITNSYIYNQNYQQKSRQNQNDNTISSQQSLVLSNSYVYNKKYSILYKINPNDLKVSVYRVNQQSLNYKQSQLFQTNQQISQVFQTNYQVSIDDTLKQQQYDNLNKSITMLSSISLIDINPNVSYQYCSQSSSILPLLSKSQQSLFIFTCSAIYKIKCQSIISKIQLLMVFDNQQIKQYNKIFNGIQIQTVNGYIFWLSPSQGIRIYGITLQQKLQYINTLTITQSQLKTINLYKNNQTINLNKNNNTIISSHPRLSSLQYDNGVLYILTQNYGILLFQRQLSFKFQLIAYIDYLPQHINKINYQIIVKENFILIWTKIKRWQFITQIKIIKNNQRKTNKNINNINNKDINNINSDQQTNPNSNKQSNSNSNQQSNSDIDQNIKEDIERDSNKYVLNRYYKGYRSINKILVLSQFLLTNKINQSKSNKQNKQNKQSKQHKQNKQSNQRQVLLISSQKGIQVFPLGVDVRDISIMMNGVVNNHLGDDFLQMVHITNNIWIVQKFLQGTSNQQQLQSNNYNNQNRRQFYQKNQNKYNNYVEQQQKDSLYQKIPTQVFIAGLSISYPSIDCSFPQPGNYTLLLQQSYYSILKQIHNQNKNQIEKQIDKQTFNNNTISKTIYPLQEMNNTSNSLHYEPHYYHRVFINVISNESHLSLYISLLSLIVLFIIICLLIYWRQKKLNLIDNIVSQIRRINSSKRNIHHQFNHQNSIDKKWNQLKQEIFHQLSYKVIDQNQNKHYKINYQDKDYNFKYEDKDYNIDHQDNNMTSQRGLTREFYLLQNKNFTLYQTNQQNSQRKSKYKEIKQNKQEEKQSKQNKNKQLSKLSQINKQTQKLSQINKEVQKKPSQKLNVQKQLTQVYQSIEQKQEIQNIKEFTQVNNFNNQQKQNKQLGLSYQQHRRTPYQQQERRTLHSDLQINENSLIYKQLHQQREHSYQNSIQQDQYPDFPQNITSSQQKHINLSILHQEENDK